MSDKKVSRSGFIRKAGILSVSGLALSSCLDTDKGKAIKGPSIISNKKFKWNMVTTWPPNFPILGEGCQLMADWVEELSGGRLKISVYGGGELIPALEAFDAVRSGTAEIGNGAAYYWAGKNSATQFFASVPFGMNAREVNTWLSTGGGIKLWEELYAQFNMVPMVAGNTGEQMAGWFNREINSIEDLKGLKMRMPGLGGKVLARAGGAAVLSPGSEIYTNLERGVIDATEWIGPYHDYIMGFHQIAKYYYAPGWHEPGSVLECFVNKSKLESLPKDLQAILRFAISKQNYWVLEQFDFQNTIYLQKLKNEKVDIRFLPKEVLDKLRAFTKEVMQEEAEKDAFSGRVWSSYQNFREQFSEWSSISQRSYFELINPR